MKKIGIAAKHRNAEKFVPLFRRLYDNLVKTGKEIFIEKHVADFIGLKSYKEFKRQSSEVDLLFVLGGDGTILSVIRSLKKIDTNICGINTGNLGFMSEIPTEKMDEAVSRILDGEFTVDKRMMLEVEVMRAKKIIKKFHALNEAVISQGSLARLINLPTTINGKKLTTYFADGLIVATPTGSTAYSLSAGGPIIYPSVQTFIITPICPHSFTQKPIIIPDDKEIGITVEGDHDQINLTIDGQDSEPLKCKDVIRIKRDGEAHFVRLPGESFFSTLREKLDWGKRLDK